MKKGFVFYSILLSLLLSGFSVSKANEVYTVNGIITNSDNVGVSGIRILLKNKSLTGDITLGETTSNSRGNYQVNFALPASADQLNLQVQAYDHHQNLVASSAVYSNASNRETINIQIGVVETDERIEESGPTSVPLSEPVAEPATDQPDTVRDNNARFGYGMIVGHLDGLSVIYWTNALGGQLIMSGAGSNTTNIKARLHLKVFALPFGRLSVAPQVGCQLNLSGGAESSLSNSNYGLVGVAEFILQDTWLSALTFDEAFGISAEIGLYGQGIRNIVFDPNKLTTGFSIAGHIYL